MPQELSEVGPSWDMVQVLCDHTNSRKPVGAVGKDSEWHQIEQSILGCSLLTFNQEKEGPQQHPNFRKAIDLILDRERMIEQLGGFREAPASSFLPAMNDKGTAAVHRTDLEEARRLLKEMGYDGELVTMFIYSHNNEDAIWICEQCVKAGIRIELTTRSMSDMMRLDTIHEADLIFYHICLESEYDLHIIQTLKQSNSYVRAHLTSEKKEWIDEEMVHILMIPDIKDRIARLHDIIEVLQEDQSFLFVLHRSQQTTYHDSIRGVCINDLGWVDFRKIWFTPSA
ncbi:hypothetical protein GQF01_23635 [Paenibacillus sp. 5J-6]|uniref:Solute-binding protein family 5 domain-containing protein n=1 Tax=Paenibacillus silvestris TaxID=2606219 RepID=A0A6L8V754_9BACL|nr:hypothetical protein [Paenibacillus silvestris]